MSAQLANLVGKKILAESARNHFGQEVKPIPFSEPSYSSELWAKTVCVAVGPIFRRGSCITPESRVREEDTKATQSSTSRSIAERQQGLDASKKKSVSLGLMSL